MPTRHLTTTTIALTAALALSACGSNDLATGTAPAPAASSPAHGGGGHGAARSTPPAAPAAAQANDADLQFLTGMTPHHEQAVEMSEIVLRTDPPAEVAALARRIKAAQAPEIQQMDRMLQALGGGARGEHGAGHSDGHGGMLREADLDALRDARRTEAAVLYLEGMIAHHEGAIEAAEAELRDGTYEPARQLARDIARDQAAEITEMQGLLASR